MSRMIFLNVGWMKHYQGLSDDKIRGGGSYIWKHGFGHEIMNFQPYRGRMYGYVQPSSETIDITRLGASR